MTLERSMTIDLSPFLEACIAMAGVGGYHCDGRGARG